MGLFPAKVQKVQRSMSNYRYVSRSLKHSSDD